ncbi:hypothetical protein [Ornithinibacillus scapharcae]|uniref:hypothetical protein n=1 Tax=Ornithinibacillus scapharcae TaxID=1147159 RepID=UPI001300C08C|nr:hypothetical protein [Ornithinibacillus scapharcae]
MPRYGLERKSEGNAVDRASQRHYERESEGNAVGKASQRHYEQKSAENPVDSFFHHLY